MRASRGGDVRGPWVSQAELAAAGYVKSPGAGTPMGRPHMGGLGQQPNRVVTWAAVPGSTSRGRAARVTVDKVVASLVLRTDEVGTEFAVQ